MKIEMDNERIHLVNKQEELIITCKYGEKFEITGSKYSNVDDISFEKQLENLRKKIEDSEKDRGRKPEENAKMIDNAIKVATNYVEGLHKIFKLDKSIILAAIEKNRTYWFPNYYQESNFPNPKTYEELKSCISKLNQEAWDTKKAHEKEIKGWQDKLTAARSIFVEKKEVETKVEYDLDVWVNCPFCSEYQKVDLSDWDHDGDFETIHTCEKCDKPFPVRATE